VVFCKTDCSPLLITIGSIAAFHIAAACWPNVIAIAITNGAGRTIHVRIGTALAQAARYTAHYFFLLALRNFFAQLKSGLLFHFFVHLYLFMVKKCIVKLLRYSVRVAYQMAQQGGYW
jgi:hypothetical protein